MGAIGLNPIRLDRIGLDPIRINAIKLGVPGAASGTDRPYIDPEVLASLKAVCICYGKSNDDPDRAVVKNLVDPDNPFVISNAAFKLNSGFGEHSADFESFDWAVNISQKQHNKATISLNGRLCNHTAIEVDEMKVNIIGNVTELIYWYIANPDDTTRSEIRLTSGINTLPKSYAKDDGQTYNIGFAYISGDSEITIEQIPSFEGAFVTDGIDDLITSTKTVQEMLGGSNEITVVSMIHQVKDSANNVSFTNYIRGSANGYFRNIVNNYGKTGIYGYTFSDFKSLSVINNILGDKNDYTSNGDNRDSIINGNFSVQGYSYNDGNNTGDFSSVAWYWTIIANKVLTTDQINQVIAYFNLDKYVKPDICYDVKKQGLTNNTPDADWYLKDFSGNGRDMQLYNYSKTPESGINEEGGLQSDGATDYGQYVGDLGLKDYTVAVDRAYVEAKPSQVPIMSNVVNGSVNTPFLMEHLGVEKSLAPHSFGKYTALSELNINRFISYQSTYKYNGIDITKGTSADTGSGLTIGRIGGIANQYGKICLWSLMLFPYSLSEFLLERQLKKHKLGTLYPDMVEFRPIVKSNLPYSSISYSVNPGEYISVDSMVTITVTLPNTSDKLMEVSCNAISDISISGDNGVYEITGKIVKSPQKINLVISSYLTMLSNSTLISNETLIKNE